MAKRKKVAVKPKPKPKPAAKPKPKRKAKRRPKPPSERQLRFCAEYILDLNATQAAIRAGYSPRGAKVQGHWLLTNPNLSGIIQKSVEGRAKRLEIDADKVLTDIEEAREAAFDDGDWRGSLKGSELQGRHLKMFTDKVTVESDMPLAINVKIVRMDEDDPL